MGLIIQILDPKTYEPMWKPWISKKQLVTQQIMTTGLYADAQSLCQVWMAEYFGSLVEVKGCLQAYNLGERIVVHTENIE